MTSPTFLERICLEQASERWNWPRISSTAWRKKEPVKDQNDTRACAFWAFACWLSSSFGAHLRSVARSPFYRLTAARAESRDRKLESVNGHDVTALPSPTASIVIMSTRVLKASDCFCWNNAPNALVCANGYSPLILPFIHRCVHSSFHSQNPHNSLSRLMLLLPLLSLASRLFFLLGFINLITEGIHHAFSRWKRRCQHGHSSSIWAQSCRSWFNYD